MTVQMKIRQMGDMKEGNDDTPSSIYFEMYINEEYSLLVDFKKIDEVGISRKAGDGELHEYIELDSSVAEIILSLLNMMCDGEVMQKEMQKEIDVLQKENLKLQEDIDSYMKNGLRESIPEIAVIGGVQPQVLPPTHIPPTHIPPDTIVSNVQEDTGKWDSENLCWVDS